MTKLSHRIAGVDEAGRGPLAGPVVAAAVILPNQHGLKGLTDSKKLTEKQRTQLFDEIVKQSLAWSVAQVSVVEIDEVNILRASLQAMRLAVQGCSTMPDEVWVDGCHMPDLPVPCRAIVRGDQTVEAISAASILAKVTRDQLMIDADERYPGYGFAQHKGYGTAKHLDALLALGPCALHRKSFKPVRRAEVLWKQRQYLESSSIE